MQATKQKDITLPPHNWEALKQLEKEKEDISRKYAVITMTAIASIPWLGYLGFLIFVLVYRPLERIQNLARLIKIMRLLLEEFEPLGVQIFPSLKVPEQENPLDLLVRFPKKAHILISIRSKGESKIVYNEEKEALYVRRKKKGLKVWEPCPLIELGDYTNLLTKNRELFGMSSKEVRNVPLAKVLALWKPTLIQDHISELYTTIESFKLLLLRKKGVAFVITEEDIVNFIKVFLARMRRKKPKNC